MRRFGKLPVVVTMAVMGMQAPAPASAGNDLCAADGTLSLLTGLGYPGVHPAETASFLFTFGLLGACVTKTHVSFDGTLTGHCGLSSGQGITQNGHTFTFSNAGTLVILSGGVTGVVSAVNDPTHAGDCRTKTATRFMTTGPVLTTHLCDDTGTGC